jgi:DNA repair exonuclease SbcCD ATPase subunit
MAVPLQVSRASPVAKEPVPGPRCFDALPAGEERPRSETDSAHTLTFPTNEAAPADEAAELRRECARLRELLDQARERLLHADKQAEHWRHRESEYESLLEEKSEVIRQLHEEREKAGCAEQAVGSAGQRTPHEEELIALEQELTRERDQLKQDEEALMAEMRNMEVQMARERADLARQRNELQRLHNQMKAELEIATRDASLRDRLAPLYRLQEEMQRRHVGGDGSRGKGSSHDMHVALPQGHSAPPPTQSLRQAQQLTADDKEPRKGGFFRKLFGG